MALKTILTVPMIQAAARKKYGLELTDQEAEAVLSYLQRTMQDSLRLILQEIKDEREGTKQRNTHSTGERN